MRQLDVEQGDVWLGDHGEWPVRNAYCKYAPSGDAVGQPHLIDARRVFPSLGQGGPQPRAQITGYRLHRQPQDRWPPPVTISSQGRQG